jgi:cell division protein FtsN
MRFEVKGGGIAAILFAVTLLSGAVFVLGLLAGYDVGRQAQIDSAQLATSYPLQSPSAAATVASNEAATSAAITPPQSAASTTTSALEQATPAASQTSVAPVSQRLASSAPPPATKQRSSMEDTQSADEDAGDAAESEGSDANEEESQTPDNSEVPHAVASTAVASTAAPVHRKPYNIQIEAAMDINGADGMMARLQKLGFQSHLVPTEIGGQRWYKVEVGPYATQEEASDAEAALRQKYDATYGGPASGNSAGPTSAGPTSAGPTSADDNSEE